MMKYIRNLLLFSGMMAFLLNHSLESLFDTSGYAIGAFFIIFGVLVSRWRKSYSKRFVLFLLIMISTCLIHYQLGRISVGFFETFLCYVVFPTLAYVISIDDVDQDIIIKFVGLTGILSFIGTSLYYLNVFYELGQFSIIFKPEITITFGEIQLKNTSIYGSSLIAGVIALVQASCCAFLLKKGHSKVWWIVFILCLIVLFASLSRRAFVPLLVVIFYLIQDLSIVKKRNFGFSVLIVFGVLAFALPDISLEVFNRFISIFDIGSGSNNVSRLEAIWFGVTQIFVNPFGTGFGSLSSVGKELDDLLYDPKSLEGFLGVTESFYVTAIGEIGLIQCYVIAVIFVGKYKLVFTDQRMKMILLPIIVESIAGLSFLNPLISLFCFMCVFPEIRLHKSRLIIQSDLSKAVI